MKYRDIDIDQALYQFLIEKETVEAVIDWRMSLPVKVSKSQLVFNRAFRMARECVDTGEYDTPDDALIRWMESGWTGMCYVLKEAQKLAEDGRRSTRDMTIKEEFSHDWAPKDDTKRLN